MAVITGAIMSQPQGVVRQFATGATRDTDTNKIDYEGFLHPLVLARFGEYMHKHRTQPDGQIRDAANWTKGMTRAAYVKSGWRHWMDVWLHHRGFAGKARESAEDALCAMLFNVQGLLLELLLDRDISE